MIWLIPAALLFSAVATAMVAMLGTLHVTLQLISHRRYEFKGASNLPSRSRRRHRKGTASCQDQSAIPSSKAMCWKETSHKPTGTAENRRESDMESSSVEMVGAERESERHDITYYPRWDSQELRLDGLVSQAGDDGRCEERQTS